MKTNITKRLTALVLALIMCLSLAATAFAADTDGNPDDADNSDITWNFTGADDDLNHLEDEELALVTSFKDVKSTAWYYSDVTECAKLGIVAGFEDGTFKPENSVTAIQFLVMLTRTFYNSKVEAIKAPAGASWYYANTTVASNVGMSTGLAASDINDTKGMTRYNMALVLHNILVANGKSITAIQQLTVQKSITDYNSVPNANKPSVANCYAQGIITGMDDGSFAGTQSMTRAQACTVIMRMLKLINNYNPGDKDNDTYDDGTSQVQNTLANGKPITTANVLEILNQIKAKYPTGTIWTEPGTAGNNYYTGTAGEDMVNLNKKFMNTNGSYGGSSLKYACGGWAAMVSETIFGKSGYPFRQVTSAKDVRPGDVIIWLNTEGKLSHYGVAASNPTQNSGGIWQFTTCEGNAGGKVIWGMGCTLTTGTVRVYTRYPD